MRNFRKWRDYLIDRLATDKDEAIGCRLSIVPLEVEKPDIESASEAQRISAAG